MRLNIWWKKNDKTEENCGREIENTLWNCWDNKSGRGNKEKELNDMKE